jgi:hypothetical protein
VKRWWTRLTTAAGAVACRAASASRSDVVGRGPVPQVTGAVPKDCHSPSYYVSCNPFPIERFTTLGSPSSRIM